MTDLTDDQVLAVVRLGLVNGAAALSVASGAHEAQARLTGCVVACRTLDDPLARHDLLDRARNVIAAASSGGRA